MSILVDAEGHRPSRVKTYAFSAVMLASKSGMPGASAGCENGRMRPFRIASATARPENFRLAARSGRATRPGSQAAYRDSLQDLPKLSV
jgi:hypothetical protein